ncbi:hypothetical protein ACXX82_08615 [Glaciimonas sp. GNP009]
MKKLLRLGIYLASFMFARGTLFFAPIALANLLPIRSYGTVEWAYAAASFGASITAIGTGAALPLITLNKAVKGTMSGILAHHIVVVLMCVALICGALLLNGGIALQMAALLVSAVALQALWSIHLKTCGKGEASLLLDAGLFALMAFTAAAVNYLHLLDSLFWLACAVAAYVFCLLSVTAIALFKRLYAGEVVAYQTILTLGFPLMLGAMVTIAATTSGRLVIGYLGGPLLTADYAILARAAALPIVAHQIVLVAKFRHLYTLQDKEMERVISFILGMVAFSVVGLWVVSPFFSWMLGPAFAKAFQSYTLPALWILSQSILWSGISLNDTINTRKQAMHKVLPWSVLFLVISIPFSIVLIRYVGVTLAHFVYIHGLLMLLFYLTQIFAMYQAGIRLFRAWTFSVCAYVILITLASLMY